jgi:murein DD-endopeptidase MepM/ murein hydrolase activator NlpD
VADGDTLGLISEIYQTPVGVIQRLNDLHPDSIIYPGETLRVPTQLTSEVHLVAPGETLSHISRQFDTPVSHVRALNGLDQRAVIHPGETLKVLRGTNAVILERERDSVTEERTEETFAAPSAAKPRRVESERSDPDDGNAARDASPEAPLERERSVERSIENENDNGNERRNENERRNKTESKRRSFLSSVLLFPARAVNATVDSALRVSELARSRRTVRVWRPIRLPKGAPRSPEATRLMKTSRILAKPGDSLASVAAAHALPIRDLQRANGITNDRVDVGQSLRVTRLRASERSPRLRRRTKRHLFQRDAETDIVRRVDERWRRVTWRYQPRGGDGEEFFSRRTGVGRSDGFNCEAGLNGDARDASNAAMLAAAAAPRRAMSWEDRRPRRRNTSWHPRFSAPLRETREEKVFLSSGFGWRWGRLHAGVDLAANEGAPVRAVAGGAVLERVFDAAGYGWLLRVGHGDGWETRYAHCRVIHARPGAKVRRGQKVAEVGNTGRSFGPHLHFEVRRNGTPIDPLTCSDA